MFIKINIIMRKIFSLVIILYFGTAFLFSQSLKNEEVLFDNVGFSLDEVLNSLISIGRYEQKMQDVPAILSIYTSKDLKRLGIKNINELLQILPGFQLQERNYGGVIFIRGISPNVLFLLDGNPLRMTPDEMVVLGKNIFPIDQIKRVEILKGPASVLYGANALGGVINIVTKNAADFESNKLKFTCGDNDSRGAFFSSGFQKNGFDVFVSSSIYKTKEEEIEVDDSLYDEFFEGVIWGNNGKTENSKDSYYDFFGKLLYKDAFGFSIRKNKAKDYYQISEYGALLDSDSENLDQRTLLHLTAFTKYIISDNCYMTFNYSRLENESGLNKSYYLFPRSEILPYGYFYHILETKSTIDQYDLSINFSFGKNHLLFGLSYLEERHPADIALENDPYTGEIFQYVDTPVIDLEVKSLYIQDQYIFNDMFTIFAGCRLDEHDIYEDLIFLPKFSIMYDLNLKWGMKFLYSEGFRDSLIVQEQGTKELDPEKSQSYEIEILYKYSANLNYISTFAYNKYSDFVGNFMDEVTGNLITSNQAEFLSLELSQEIKFLAETGDGGFFNFSWNQVENKSPGAVHNYFRIPAKFTLNAGFFYHLTDKTLFSGRLQYVGKRKADIFIKSENSSLDQLPVQNTYIDDYVKCNISFDYQDIFTIKGVNLSFKIDNLFDVEYEHPVVKTPSYYEMSYPWSGRQYSLEVTYLF